MNWREIERDYPRLLLRALRGLGADEFYPAGGAVAAGRETLAITGDGVLPVFNPSAESDGRRWRPARAIAPEGSLALVQYCEDLEGAIVYDRLPTPPDEPYDGPMGDSCEPDPRGLTT